MTALGALGRRLLLRLPAALRAPAVMRLILALWERVASRHPDEPSNARSDGPWPPPRLRLRTVGTVDVDWYARSGELSISMIDSTLGKIEVDPATLESILDFGCGCGRVAHAWPAKTAAAVSGCDIDDALVGWCRAHYPWLDARRNSLLPPTTFDGSSFDFIYALSVFTHLAEDTQQRWIDEFRRILRPSGLLLLTTHGESHTAKLSGSDRGAFARGELVVELLEVEGSNLCAAYHPPECVEKMLGDEFELLSFEPAGEAAYLQDVILARRRR